MNRLKICVIGDVQSSFEGSNLGGGENQLAGVAKLFAELGCEVSVIDYSIAANLQYRDISFYALNPEKKTWLDVLSKRSIRLYNLLLERNADIYFSSMCGYHHIISFFASQKSNAKFVYWAAADLDFESFYQRYKYYYKYKMNARNLINIILTEITFPFVTRYANLLFVQHSGQLALAKNKNAMVLPNFIEVNHHLNKVDKDDYCVWVGSISEIKGFEKIQLILEQVPNIQIKVIGKIRSENCKKILKILHRYPNFTYLGFLSNYDDVLKAIAHARFLFNTSAKEGFPITFLEAWANNTPVISLYVDPGNIIEANNLGYCAQGDWNRFINAFNHFHSLQIRADLQEYVEIHHSKQRITNILKNSLMENLV